MRVKQVSVFVENQPGRLSDVLSALADSDINIRALSIADTVDFAILRLILSDVEKGIQVLRDAGLTVRTNEVLQVEVPDDPGGLNDSLVKPLAEGGINIEYIYALILPRPGKAVVLAKVRNIAGAVAILGD